MPRFPTKKQGPSSTAIAGPSAQRMVISVSEVVADVAAVQADLISTLESTTWPPTATTEVEAFIQAVKVGFNHDESLADQQVPSEPIDDAIRALRGTHRRLKERADAFNKSKNTKRDIIESYFRPPQPIVQFLRTRRTMAENSLAALSDAVRNAGAAPDPGVVTSPLPPPAGPSNRQSSRRWEWLDVVKVGFKAMDDTSGAIPHVGNYIGAVAKAGLRIILMLETMNDNDAKAKKLGQRVCRLKDMLDQVTKNSDDPKRSRRIEDINNLQAELNGIKIEVEDMQSHGKGSKFIAGERNAGRLKELQDEVRAALEDTQSHAVLTTSLITQQIHDDSLLDRLGDGHYGARANLTEATVCLPGTRVNLLRRIDAWIADEITEDRVRWVSGMAGRGKSTVASTVARKWKDKIPCAIFHFRRGQNSLDTELVCSLAKQLARCGDGKLRDSILASVRSNKDIATQSLEEQFTTLLAGPLFESTDNTTLIIVDALDECGPSNYARDFVKLVKRHAGSFPPTVKFLLTTRPEYPLLPTLRDAESRVESLDLEPVDEVIADVEQYLRHGLAEIRKQHLIQGDWPPENTIPELARMSEGLFQWAQTVLAFVDSRAPETRLDEILDPSEAWAGLDSLYKRILSKAIEEVQRSKSKSELFFQILETILAAAGPVSLEVLAFLHDDAPAFKGKDSAKAPAFLRDEILSDLNSLLLIPPATTDSILLMHTSIRDFLLDKRRCDEGSLAPWVDIQARLSTSCLCRMNRLLKENICDLPSASTPLSDLAPSFPARISEGLRYCCQSWALHLTESGRSSTSSSGPSSQLAVELQLERFSTEKALFWLEAMAVVGCLSQAIQMAKDLYPWLLTLSSKAGIMPLIALWDDIRRFGAAFGEPISWNPLQIYTSALAHCPRDTELWRRFQTLAKIQTTGGPQPPGWSPAVWTKATRSAVWSVAISPDGKLLASGSEDQIIQLWDPDTGNQVGESLSGHTSAVVSVCFSPDGKLLASGSDDKTIRLWDPQTGSQVREPLSGHTDILSSVCFSPDGKLLASGSYDWTIRLWDPHSGSQVGEPLSGHTDIVSSVCFSPDGKLLASGSWDNTLRVWDPQTGIQVGAPLWGHRGWVTSVCFSPDGKLLASGSWDNTVRLWDPHTGSQAGEPLSGHRKAVMSVCFSPDGELLASGSADNKIRLWDPHTGSQVDEPLSADAIVSVCFLPDGKLLASGSEDCTIRLWDPHTRSKVEEPPSGHMDSVSSVCFSSDGKLVASGSDDWTIRRWDPHTGSQVGEPLSGHKSFVRSVCFSPDSKLLASGSQDETIRLWDPHTGSQVGEPLSGDTGSVLSVCFSPNGALLGSGSIDGTVRLWDPHTGKQVGAPLTGHRSWVTSVRFSPDGKLLASGSEDRTIRLWDPQTGSQVLEPLSAHTDCIMSVCFSPDGQLLASGSADQKILLWNPHTGSQVGEPLSGHENWVMSVCFSSDGKLLASGSLDYTIRLWDPHTGSQVREPLSGHTDCIMSICFSPDGKLLASGSSDWTIQLWDTHTGSQVGEPPSGHKNSILSVCFSPDGKLLASGSYDNTIRLWDPHTGSQVGAPLSGHTSWVRSVCFSPDGKLLASGSQDTTIRLWYPQTGKYAGGPLSVGNPIESVYFSSDGTQVHVDAHSLAGAPFVFTIETRGIPQAQSPSRASNFRPILKEGWIYLGSEPILWLPSLYRPWNVEEIALSHGRIAVAVGRHIFFFDISRLIDFSEELPYFSMS